MVLPEQMYHRDELLSLLHSGNREKREDALRRVNEWPRELLSNPAIWQALVKVAVDATHDLDAVIRSSIITVIAHEAAQNADLREWLMALLHDENGNPKVMGRDRAVNKLLSTVLRMLSLSLRADRRVRDLFLARAQSTEASRWTERRIVIAGLASGGLAALAADDPEVRAVLLRSLSTSREGHYVVRSDAARALTGAIHIPEVRDALLRALDSRHEKDSNVRAAVLNALASVFGSLPSETASLTDNQTHATGSTPPRADGAGVRNTLPEWASAVVQQAHKILKRKNEKEGVFKAAANVLTSVARHDPTAARALVAHLHQHPNDTARRAVASRVAEALGGNEDATSDLKAALLHVMRHDNSAAVRRAIAEALTPHVGDDPDILAAFLDGIADETDFGVLMVITEALKPVAAHSTLVADVCGAAILADDHTRDRRVVEQFIDLMAPHAAESDKVVQALIALSASADFFARRKAVSVLASVAALCRDVRDTLVAVLADEQERAAVKRAAVTHLPRRIPADSPLYADLSGRVLPSLKDEKNEVMPLLVGLLVENAYGRIPCVSPEVA